MGPSAQILFSTVAMPAWQATFDAIMDLVQTGDRWHGSYFIKTTRPIGGSYEGEGRGFSLDVGTDLPWDMWDPGDAGGTPRFYEQQFGIRPDNGAWLHAGPNRPEDHRILGEITAAVAERLGGIINMGGLIVPRDGPCKGETASWPDVRAGVEAFTASMPGKAIACPYQVWNGSEWAWHVVDVEFLRAWLRHPEFHMIK